MMESIDLVVILFRKLQILTLKQRQCIPLVLKQILHVCPYANFPVSRSPLLQFNF